MSALVLAPRHFDHTLLRPEATAAQVARTCREAAAHGFAAACVPPCHVAAAAALLAGTGVAVCTVVGFPLGYAAPAAKLAEAEVALADGATELDMVLNVSALKSGLDAAVRADVAALAARCHAAGALLKVILETALLDEAEIARAALLCAAAGADFVKTSTGFASRGASVEDVQLLRRVLPAHVRIKASGGIRTRAAALALLAAGADRLGCSNSVALLLGDEDVENPAPGPAANY